MDRSEHDMSALFAQLGEPHDAASIDAFIARHAPIASDVALHKAAFWSPMQAAFLCEAIAEDGDWAEVVDALNLRLRARPRQDSPGR